MSTYTYPISASFGAAKSGLASTVFYRVLSASGTVLTARTNSGVTERTDAAGNATTGSYEASATFDPSWGFVRVVWDITGQAGVVAEETINASAPSIGSAMTLDLTQAVPLTNTAHTIGDALNSARAEGFGNWAIVGNTLRIYAADGTTVVHQFALDSTSNPTSRTSA